MWWVFPGLVAGLVVSSLMIVYWFYRLRLALAEKGWRYMSHLWILVWLAAFFGSASGLLRTSTIIQKGSMTENTLLYISAASYWIALAALIAGLILDAIIKTR